MHAGVTVAIIRGLNQISSCYNIISGPTPKELILWVTHVLVDFWWFMRMPWVIYGIINYLGVYFSAGQSFLVNV